MVGCARLVRGVACAVMVEVRGGGAGRGAGILPDDLGLEGRWPEPLTVPAAVCLNVTAQVGGPDGQPRGSEKLPEPVGSLSREETAHALPFGVAGTWELKQEECGRERDVRGRRAPSSEVASGARRPMWPCRGRGGPAPAPAPSGWCPGRGERGALVDFSGRRADPGLGTVLAAG